MEIKKVKLIALDLDGTLLLPDKTLSETNKEVLIRAAEENGIYIVLATGRPYWGVKKVLEWLPCVKYAVLSNGAVVRDIRNGQIISEKLIKAEDALEFYEYAASESLIIDFFDRGKRIVPSGWREAVTRMEISEGIRHLLITNCIITDDQRTYLTQTQGIEKISVRFCNGIQREEFYDKFQKKFPHLKVSASLKSNIEATAGGITKAAGLEKLTSYLGIQMDDVMAFGDSENDLEMIQAAGTGVAMGNAENKIKHIADRITRKNTEDGVAYMVREVLRWKQESL